ncbi:YybH family protein [Granulicella cerasi]|uniref:YybH family protein n=1 Tax=Granulicella cerasi TaxID=741063 RepID=A0ABW1Z925_9BACT|nr:DUF4440 domain-containing protein [Granulicella cerasi]
MPQQTLTTLRRALLAGCMSLALPLAGCNYTNTADTRIKDEQLIRTADAKWSIAASEHNIDATMAPYTDDAMLLAPDEAVATTPDAIRDSWTKTFAALSSLSWEITRIEVARSGDLAYLTGKWTAMLPDKKTQITGKLLEVWHKQPDGSWKCIADTYNNDAPAK